MKNKSDIIIAINTIENMLSSENDDLNRLADDLEEMDIECTGDCFGCAAHHVFSSYDVYQESCSYNFINSRADIIRKRIQALELAKKSLERSLI